DSAAAQSLIQLLGGFRDFLPRIPRAGLELGTTWSDTLDRSQKGGGRDVTFHTVVQGRATAWEDYAGTRSLRVAGTVSYTVAGTAQTASQRVRAGCREPDHALPAPDGRHRRAGAVGESGRSRPLPGSVAPPRSDRGRPRRGRPAAPAHTGVQLAWLLLRLPARRVRRRRA